MAGPASPALDELARIDWTAPWLAPYAAGGRALAGRAAALGSVVQALDEALQVQGVRLPAGPLRAVPQAALPPGQAYEAHIAATARLPTRDNLHDFFNGLMWLHWPALKARLNALQARAIADQGVGGVRGPLRDALTLFDENGALWCGPAGWRAHWQARDWCAFLWRGWGGQPAGARLTLFGHALLEQLARHPRKGLCAHGLAWVAPPGADAAARAVGLSPQDWAAKPFLPLPVAGVPGWWPGQDEAFYRDDPQVFRPRAGAAQAPVGRKPSTDR